MNLNNTIAKLKELYIRLNSDDIKELVTLLATNNDKAFDKMLRNKLTGWE